MSHALVVVGTFSNRFDAEVAKTALDAADIQSMIHADDVGGLRPGLWMGNGVELVVNADDAERAKRILKPTA